MAIKIPFLDLRDLSCAPLGIIIFYVFMNSVATSIWVNGSWTPFVFQLFGNSNFYVGLMAALNGIFQLLFAFLAARLSDKVIGPSKTLIIASHFGVFTLLFAFLSIWLNVLWLIVISQSLYGAFLGLNFTSIESVFAQCVKQGERDHIYGVKFSLEASGPIVGSLLSLMCFFFFGNSWSVEVLRWVLTAGIILQLVSVATFLMYFKPIPSHLDSTIYCCDERESGADCQKLSQMQEESRSFQTAEELALVEVDGDVCKTTATPAPPLSFQDKNASFSFARSSENYEKCQLEEGKRCLEWKSFFLLPLERYPYIIVLSDLVTTLGSGMTIRYFQLFMMNAYFLSPAALVSLGVMIAVLISVLVLVNSHIGKKFGRARALFFPKLLGSFILLYMALARGTSAGPTWLMCVAYVTRMALMNSTKALSRALIMDTVAERTRGMWNAVESLQSASWSGTALIGGILADKFGYGAAFIVTFFFHITACLLVFPCTLRNDALMTLQRAAVDDGRNGIQDSSVLNKVARGGDVGCLTTDTVTVHNIIVEEKEEKVV